MNEFKSIPGYIGYYKIDKFGNVLSLPRRKCLKSGRLWVKSEKLLTWNFGKKKKYPSVALYVNGKNKRMSVHRLVFLSHIGRIPEGMQINHIDGNPNNPKLDNLELVTPSENMQHAFKMGLVKIRYGVDTSAVKLDENKVKQIRKLSEKGQGQTEIAKIFGVHQTNIHYILTGKTWSHVK